MASLLLCGLLSSPIQASAVFRLPIGHPYEDTSRYFSAGGRITISGSADYTTDTFLAFTNAAGESLKIYEITLSLQSSGAAVNDIYMRTCGTSAGVGDSWDMGAASRDDEVGEWFFMRAPASSAVIPWTMVFPASVKKLVFCTSGVATTITANYIAVVGK